MTKFGKEEGSIILKELWSPHLGVLTPSLKQEFVEFVDQYESQYFSCEKFCYIVIKTTNNYYSIIRND